jgi:hypothetical protein
MIKRISEIVKPLLLFTAIILACQSCFRDFGLEMPEVEKQIAVNCIFSPDSSWAAHVYFTHHPDSTADNLGVKNATVVVEDDFGNSVSLIHAGDGWYKAAEKPEQGKTYNLSVAVEGNKTVTAESYVPPETEIGEMEFLPRDRIKFNISPTEQGAFYAGIRGRWFNPVTGYNIYCINRDVIEKIKLTKNIPDTTVNKLKALEGQTLYSYNVVEKVQELLTAQENFHHWYLVQEAFEEFAVCGKLDSRPQSMMKFSGCSSDQVIFYQAPNDYTTLLMNQSGKQEVEISCTSESEYQPHLEFWLEYMDLSSDYYFFLKDFLLQLSNRDEINAPPVIVYSNIENGVGIFAGYKSQLFLLNDSN